MSHKIKVIETDGPKVVWTSNDGVSERVFYTNGSGDGLFEEIEFKSGDVEQVQRAGTDQFSLSQFNGDVERIEAYLMSRSDNS